MTKFRLFAALAGCLLASACSQSSTPAQTLTPKAASPQVVAECALLNKAMVASAGSGKQDLGIVRGCPGYENVQETDNRFSGAGKFLGAASAAIPPKAQTKFGKILFQRMIARGVSKNVAVEMVETPEFDAAVAALNAG